MSKEKIEDVTSQGATISVLFDPDDELTQRLNAEKEFQFVVEPTAEGQKDAEGDDGGSSEEEEPSGEVFGG